MQIPLNKNTSKEHTNVSNTVYVDLSNTNGVLPSGLYNKSVDSYGVYLKERKESDKIRLIVQINSYASNVLFNPITEVVKNEGSDEVECLNFISNNGKHINGTVGHTPDYKWNYSAFTEDTQISNAKCGYDYHCGIDIFNNHILRSRNFKSIEYHISPEFNTISDIMYDSDNEEVIDWLPSNDKELRTSENSITGDGFSNIHVYGEYNDAYSFNDCISEKLIERNGWLGFINGSKMPSYDKDGNDLDINKVLNNYKAGDFIDMYPSRDLFSFAPKYNREKRRIEKNWEYCLMFPYSSTTSGISCINSELKSLKICCFEEGIINDNGQEVINMYTVSQHGLSEGDYINLYNDNNELVAYKLLVTNVINKYIFQVSSDGIKISDKWYHVSGDTVVEAEAPNNKISVNMTWDDGNGNVYVVTPSNFLINLDENSQNMSFKKNVNDYECDYYCRVFAKLPNFKNLNDGDIVNEETLYGYDPKLNFGDDQRDLIYSYGKIDFENHVNKFGFSKTIYNDDIAEIVYTDDIDLRYLKDNLGRPLSEIYLTVFKTNKGHEIWYNKDSWNDEGKLKSGNSDDIEYSHCFGDVSNLFILSDISRLTGKYKNDAKIVTKDGVKLLYNDICCYNYGNCVEEVIQPSVFRFNTVQRELKTGEIDGISSITYRDIVSGDYDDTGFLTEQKSIPLVGDYKEGYYYKASYQIPVHYYSDLIYEEESKKYEISKISPLTILNKIYYKITSLDEFNVLINEKIEVYEHTTTNVYIGKVNQILGKNVIVVEFFNEIANKTNDALPDMTDFNNLTLCTRNEYTPYYANLMKDGSCRYHFRKFNKNDDFSPFETYPFLNGAFYINKNINFYLRREDPNGNYNLWSSSFQFEPAGEKYLPLENSEIDNYYSEEKLDECGTLNLKRIIQKAIKY